MRAKKWFAIGAAVVTAAAGAIGLSSAQATLSGATFEGNDGNIVVGPGPGGVDWANLVASGGTLALGIDQPTGADDNSFTQGSKEDDVNVTIGNGSIPNSKADIGKFAVGSQVIQSGARAGNFQMLLAWIRNNDGGTTNFDFEINQAAQPDMSIPVGSPPNTNRAITLNRTGDGPGPLVDDLLINYDLQGGASTPTLTIQRWQGTAWGQLQTLTSANSEGKINCVSTGAGGTCPNGAGAISQPNSGPFNQAIAATRFGEAAIDLTAIGIIPNQNDPNASCLGFGSAYVKSRSSSAFTSQMKDYSAPIGLNLDTCGSIKVIKATDPSPDATDTTFDYTRSGPGTAYDAPFDLKDGEFDLVEDLTPGSYTVTETDPGPNFALQSLVCNDANGTVVGATANITLDANEDVVCTYTNRLQRGRIIVNKVAERDGVPFHFNASYDADGFDLANGESNDSGELLPGGYSVSEDVPAGWNLQSATCDDDDGSDPATIVLDPDETVNCTFTNVIERGAVAIHKDRKHAASGPGNHPHEGVTFTITNATNGTNQQIVTDTNGNACLDSLPVSVLDGDYIVTETLPAGYAPEGDLVKTTVVTEGGCADATPVAFVNIPLTDALVQVTSQVAGGTRSSIDCDFGSVPLSDDPVLNTTDLQPGTYNCTIVIDP